MHRAWGIHGVFNIYKACPTSIRSAQNIYNFNKSLVQRIDMKAYGEPQIVHFGSDDKAGYTLCQLIETSNICAHFVEETNCIYLDVFSCKNFDSRDVEEVVKAYFKPEAIQKQVLIRHAKPNQTLQ